MEIKESGHKAEVALFQCYMPINFQQPISLLLKKVWNQKYLESIAPSF